MAMRIHLMGMSISSLQVLNQAAGYTARAANHRGHTQHGGDSAQAFHTDGYHHQRGDNQRGQGQTADGLIRGAH